jgi:hypothetical protein
MPEQKHGEEWCGSFLFQPSGQRFIRSLLLLEQMREIDGPRKDDEGVDISRDVGPCVNLGTCHVRFS